MEEPTLIHTIPPQHIVVIHPGSLMVRIGRASDLNPVSVLHVIARRRKPGGLPHRDPLLPPQVERTNELTEQLEEMRLQVSHTLQSCLQSDGRRRYATPPQQISAFNRRSQPNTISAPSGTGSTIGTSHWIKPEGDIVIGDEVLLLDPSLNFNIHFPMRRGELNIHAGPGGSLSAVVANLATIWSHLLDTGLNLPVKQRRHCRAVLVIPDIYNRQYLKELTSLLLSELGFGGCFLLQDHVAATFGAGLGIACVVDVGDQKTSVSCVEDGISHRNTRVRMEYGGGDITQTFHWLLNKCAFPYKNCDPQDMLDASLLHQLKQDFCHVNLDVCGSQEKTLCVVRAGKSILEYTFQLGDETIVAPLGLFHPELLAVTGAKTVVTQRRSPGDPEDPHDDHYLRETGRRGTREAFEVAAGGGAPDGGAGGAGAAGGGGGGGELAGGGEDDIVVDGLEVSGAAAGAGEFILGPNQLLGLDQAILQSIERCPSEDLKRKMYGCILVVGGGMKFNGIATWLQNRLHLQVPYMYRTEQMDMITTPKDTDPQLTAWKGASILSCLESAQELWILPPEWERIGVKLLRERAPFMW